VVPKLEGKVAVVTGAGRGIGREHAIALARAGARIVVNDLGASLAGEGADTGPADGVVREIEALGGEAVANGENVAGFAGAKRLIDAAVSAFGRLDILVNNAGILRDRMLVNMEEHEWDAVIETHLKGHFAPTRHAAAYWRERSKAGDHVAARVINTSSPSGVFGNVGQVNYGAAKAGIVGFTLIAAQELQRSERSHCLKTASTLRIRGTTRRSSSRSARTRPRTSPARCSSSTAASSTCSGAGRRGNCSQATSVGTRTFCCKSSATASPTGRCRPACSPRCTRRADNR
jgi:NAD(P)-dependent dehydrogenase (short-subunit alcohol dehydrogenase family)